MSILARSAAVVLALASFALACSSSTSGTNTSSSSGGTSGGASPKISNADCQSRCKTKATTCGAPASDAAQGCTKLCDGSFTDAQLVCLEGASCESLQNTSSLAALCPDTSGGSSGSSGTSGGTPSGKQLGEACTCADASASGFGTCKGTDLDCASNLTCVYASGSSGKGTCMGDRCCESTSACDKDSSLLQSCTAGTCKSSAAGYYCQK